MAAAENRNKILFIGHSWINDIEKHHHQYKEVNYDFTFNAQVSGGIDELLHKFDDLIKPEYSHVMLLCLFDDAFSTSVLTIPQDTGSSEEYVFACVKKDFDSEAYVLKINELTTKCSELNPEMSVVVIIPPCMDLNHYNALKLRDCPPHVVDAYKEKEEYSLEKVHEDCVTLYKNIVSEFKNKSWFRKCMFSSQIINNAPRYQANCREYMHGRILTLDGGGVLKDGFNPSDIFITMMWSKLLGFNLLPSTSVIDSPKSSAKDKPNVADSSPKLSSDQEPKGPQLTNSSPGKAKGDSHPKNKNAGKRNTSNFRNTMGADAKRPCFPPPPPRNPFLLRGEFQGNFRPNLSNNLNRMNANSGYDSFPPPRKPLSLGNGLFNSSRGPQGSIGRNFPNDLSQERGPFGNNEPRSLLFTGMGNEAFANMRFKEERFGDYRSSSFGKGPPPGEALLPHPLEAREYDSRDGPCNKQRYPSNVGNVVEKEVIRMMARLSISLQKEGYDYTYNQLRGIVTDIVDKHDQL